MSAWSGVPRCVSITLDCETTVARLTDQSTQGLGDHQDQFIPSYWLIRFVSGLEDLDPLAVPIPREKEREKERQGEVEGEICILAQLHGRNQVLLQFAK